MLRRILVFSQKYMHTQKILLDRKDITLGLPWKMKLDNSQCLQISSL